MDKTKSVNTSAIISMPVATIVIWIQNHFYTPKTIKFKILKSD